MNCMTIKGILNKASIVQHWNQLPFPALVDRLINLTFKWKPPWTGSQPTDNFGKMLLALVAQAN